MLIEVLNQIIHLPIRLAQAVVHAFQHGTAEDVSVTVTVGGRKVGIESRVFLFDTGQGKGAPAGQTPATP